MDQHGADPLENLPWDDDTGLEPAGSPGAGPPPQAAEHGTGDKLAKQTGPQRVERPLTIGQLQRVLEMRLGFTVSQNALTRWCRTCKIRAVRLGSEWRIPRETVEEIIKAAKNGERF
jgi:hypothetical protein